MTTVRPPRPVIAVRTIEVNVTYPFAPKAGRSNPMAVTASAATETTARRHNGDSNEIFLEEINSE